jgi:pyoverdine/dityrosine biosynthesis protein Dit1
VVDDLVTQGVPAFEAATPMLSQLLKAEMAEREVRSITYHTKVARFSRQSDIKYSGRIRLELGCRTSPRRAFKVTVPGALTPGTLELCLILPGA